MKSILIVDPLSAGQRYIDAAAKLGYRVVVLLTRDRSLYEDLHCIFVTEGTYAHPQVQRFVCVRTVKEAVQTLRMCGENIVAVIPGSDAGVESADQIAVALGLVSNDPNLSMARRDKGLMKDVVGNVGLRTAQYTRVTHVEDGLIFAARVGYPLIAKTPTGAASFNVFKCDNQMELGVAIATIVDNIDPFQRKQQDCVLEEFIYGTEYVVNLFSDGESVRVTDIWQYEKVENEHASHLYFNNFTRDPSDPEFADLKEYAKAVVKALGIKYGPTHGEFFIDKQGPVLVEVGARPSGGGMATVFADTGQFDVFTATICAYTHTQVPSSDASRVNSGSAWIVSVPNTETGNLSAITGLDHLKGIPQYLEHTVTVKPGDAMKPTRDLLTVPLRIWLVDKSGASLKSVADEVRAKISFVFELMP